MPRLIDYSSRFAYMREAAFAIVRDRGVAHLSRRAIAEELGLAPGAVRRVLDRDARLEGLAADEVINQSRKRRWGWPRPSPGQGDHDHSVALLRRLLPDSDSRIDEELVWLRLMVDSPSGVPDVLVPHVSELSRVVVDGLTLAVCTGRLTPDDAVKQLRACLAGG